MPASHSPPCSWVLCLQDWHIERPSRRVSPDHDVGGNPPRKIEEIGGVGLPNYINIGWLDIVAGEMLAVLFVEVPVEDVNLDLVTNHTQV